MCLLFIILHPLSKVAFFIRENFVSVNNLTKCDNNCPQVKNYLKLSISNINLSMVVGKADHTYKQLKLYLQHVDALQQVKI